MLPEQLILNYPDNKTLHGTIVTTREIPIGYSLKKSVLVRLDDGNQTSFFIRQLLPYEFGQKSIEKEFLFEEYKRKWQKLINAGLPVPEPLINIGNSGLACFPDYSDNNKNFFFGHHQEEAIVDSETDFAFGSPRVVSALANIDMNDISKKVDQIADLATEAGIVLPTNPGSILVRPNGTWQIMIIDFADADVDTNPLNIEVLNYYKSILLKSIINTSIFYAKKINNHDPSVSWFWRNQGLN